MSSPHRNDPDYKRKDSPDNYDGHTSGVRFMGKTGIPKHKLTGGLEGSVKRMLDITPNSGIGAKTKALKGKAGMYTSPTGSKHRIGSQKHRYWENIKRIGRDAPHGEHSL